jgi:hypothetical protein
MILNAYLVGQLIGAVIAVTALSRILFAGTKSWPLSAWKLFYINILSAVLAISWAIIGNGISAGGTFSNVGRSFVIYGSAQCLVLAVDLLRYRYRRGRGDQELPPIQTRVEPRF